MSQEHNIAYKKALEVFRNAQRAAARKYWLDNRTDEEVVLLDYDAAVEEAEKVFDDTISSMDANNKPETSKVE